MALYAKVVDENRYRTMVLFSGIEYVKGEYRLVPFENIHEARQISELDLKEMEYVDESGVVVVDDDVDDISGIDNDEGHQIDGNDDGDEDLVVLGENQEDGDQELSASKKRGKRRDK